MSTSTYIEELLERWQELRDQGAEPAAATLCKDQPQLTPQLERRIRIIKNMEKMLPLDASAAATAAGIAPSGSPLDRYEVIEKLGEGGMGVVFKARERETGRLVALKKMKQFEPAALERFKKEYRTLQEVSHPNLVTLYDVISDGTQWCFTMELIEGRPFPGSTHSPFDDALLFTVDTSSTPPGGLADTPAGESAAAPAMAGNLDGIRDAAIQLAEGLLALHEHGVLHRDIKPSNVLVTPQGVVKLLDVGLATAAVNEQSLTQQGMAGTPAYMAPEQANGQAEKASDWYSFGVLLYEALTGRHPFRGTGHELPWTRQAYEPPAPRTLVNHVPDDLDRLCAELLRFTPRERPSGADVVALLRSGKPGGQAATAAMPATSLFLGRERHLAALADAFAASQSGSSVVMFLHGHSGMGKSALAQHFLKGLRQANATVVVLGGRCYERESVPYKALDGVVDSLSRFWRRLPRQQAVELLPRDVGPLVRVFPALRRVEAVAGAPRPGGAGTDPHEQRRRAFAALREILGRIGDRWPLVLYLDDLQWGDIDSAAMLNELLTPPDSPRLLLLACFRSEDRGTSPFLSQFLSPATTTAIDRRELPVEPLSVDEARGLAENLLRESAIDHPEQADAVARESAGNPFFIYPLVQAIRAGQPVVLDQVLWTRICSLGEHQRQLLEIVAVAGRPMRINTAIRAAELEEEGRTAVIELQAARLLRSGPAEQPEIEAYHDRIRETVVAHLTPESLRERHRRVAIALESSGRADPEVLAEHFDHSGEKERAGEYYTQAAEQAAQALAFDRAVKLYRLALEVRSVGVEERCRLQTLLGKALANAGRGADAARAYLAAAADAPSSRVPELQRLAGEQFLRSGRLDEGLDVLRHLLGSIGLTLAETRWQTVWSFLTGRLRMWWRGTRFTERPASEIPADELARLDLCWSIGAILALADTFRGSTLHLRYFPAALDAGEPGRVALALGGLAVQDAIWGGQNQTRGDAWLAQACELAARAGGPHTRATVELMAGARDLLVGRWKGANDAVDRAELIYRKECTGVAWELGIAYHYRFTALYMRGLWKKGLQELPPLLREARDRGDLFTATSLQIHSAHLDLVADDPDGARQSIADALRQWNQRAFHLQHHHAMYGEADAFLYAGQPLEAWKVMHGGWPALEQSLLLKLQEIRIAMYAVRGRCALAAALVSSGARQSELLREVERATRQLERERMPWADPFAALTRAALALRAGRQTEAIARLESAASGFASVDMLIYAAVARWQLGRLLGGERGQALIADAKASMVEQEVRNPIRFCGLYAPGFSFA